MTCGPTCLHAVYNYFGDKIALDQVIAETPALQGGGTLAVFLGCHALDRGYRATLYTYNLQVFDPTWFGPDKVDLRRKLIDQAVHKADAKLRAATSGYLEFLELGGVIHFEDLTTTLLRRYLTRDIPIITGLSATYLYRAMRECGPKGDADDVRGHPVGHFVVLCDYDKQERQVLVADPLDPNPLGKSHIYSIDIHRVLGALLLGSLTYDANVLILEPPRRKKEPAPEQRETNPATARRAPPGRVT
jgi:hypothetical protein